MTLRDLRAASSTVSAAVCGSCANRLKGLGYAADPEHRPIGLGEECTSHERGKRRPQATSVLLIPEHEVTTGADELDAAARVQAALEDEGYEVTGLEMPPVEAKTWTRPYAVGPVTNLAHGLLVAWSTAERGKDCDRFMIRHAVETARALLDETKGD